MHYLSWLRILKSSPYRNSLVDNLAIGLFHNGCTFSFLSLGEELQTCVASSPDISLEAQSTNYGSQTGILILSHSLYLIVHAGSSEYGGNPQFLIQNWNWALVLPSSILDCRSIRGDTQSFRREGLVSDDSFLFFFQPPHESTRPSNWRSEGRGQENHLRAGGTSITEGQ